MTAMSGRMASSADAVSALGVAGGVVAPWRGRFVVARQVKAWQTTRTVLKSFNTVLVVAYVADYFFYEETMRSINIEEMDFIAGGYDYGDSSFPLQDTSKAVDQMIQAAVDANNQWLASHPVQVMDPVEAYQAARAADPAAAAQDRACDNGLLGGAVAGLPGGVLGVVVGAIGGGIAGGCLDDKVVPGK